MLTEKEEEVRRLMNELTVEEYAMVKQQNFNSPLWWSKVEEIKREVEKEFLL